MKRRWNRVIVTPRHIYGTFPDKFCNIVIREPTGKCKKLPYYGAISRIVWRMNSVLYNKKMIFHWRYAKS